MHSYHILHFSSVSSTQEIARSIGKDGFVIVTDEQKSAYGRRGRAWYAPYGGLWSTIILNQNRCKAGDNLITMAASVAVCKALNIININAGIKWPNDIFLYGKKLGGIIAEKFQMHILLGIGINTKNPVPDELKDIAISASKVDNEELLYAILEQLDYVLDLDSKDLIELWKNYSITLNREVCISDTDEELCGFAADIDEDGALIIYTKAGERKKIYTGDLRFIQKVG